MKNDYYSGTYIPGIVKWGRITLLLGTFAGFLPALVMALRDYISPVSAIIADTLMQISVSGAFYIAEPTSYFPILGIPGTYLTLLPGNTSDICVSYSSVTQGAVEVKVGTEEDPIISTIGITTSILANIMILTVGTVTGSVTLSTLPAPVEEALNFLLLMLFGTIFGQFTATRPRLGVVAAIITIGTNQLMKLGFLNFIPGNSSYVVILVAVFGSIYAGKPLYRKEPQVDW